MVEKEKTTAPKQGIKGYQLEEAVLHAEANNTPLVWTSDVQALKIKQSIEN